MLLLFPLTAFSQSSLYTSTPGKSALGMNINFLETETILRGHLISPIDHSTQMIFNVGIGLADNEKLKGLNGSIPPSLSGSVALEKMRGLGTTGLQSFLSGGLTAVRGALTDENITLLSIVQLTAFGGAGIFKRLKTSSELVITPSFGVFYGYTWVRTDYKLSDQKESTELSDFFGSIGLQLDLAPEVSVWGGLGFSFNTPNTILSVGVNWY